MKVGKLRTRHSKAKLKAATRRLPKDIATDHCAECATVDAVQRSTRTREAIELAQPRLHCDSLALM